ncbi:MAG TPA: YcdB/YcdC domain-containing protein, partial [Methanoregula sp.]|nr:YcdB/YcdC domain-containing protein [Methanoregula sp.]
MDTDNDFNKPYLPERYKQKIREKEQRKLVRKILSVAIIIIAIIVFMWVAVGILDTGRLTLPVSSPLPAVPNPLDPAVPTLSGQVTTDPVTPASLTPGADAGATSSLSEKYHIGPGVPRTSANGLLSLAGAEAALRHYYPVETSAVRWVNYSAGSSRSLFGFGIFATQSPGSSEEEVVFIDAATGTPWTPGEENAAFPRDKVNGIVSSTFPGAGSDTVRVWYAYSPVNEGVWRFLLASGNITIATGSVDASSGELLSFTRILPASGRPAEPAITPEKAQKIASNYVSDHNGNSLTLNQTLARYEIWGTPSTPAAGRYLFSWERTYLDHPVDTDRIGVAVDAVTGNVIGYDKHWSTPDYAFSQTIEKTVAQRDATFAV